jgi:hypothetical protein
VLDDARALALPRVIALTRELPFFERCGFTVLRASRCRARCGPTACAVRKRHACDEVAVVLDLVPGASEAAARRGARSPAHPAAPRVEPLLPIVS